MLSRWTDQGAAEAVRRFGPLHGDDFALRLYTARLLGTDPDLVLHGGGNVSMKGAVTTILGDRLEVVFVKASGQDMAALEPNGMPAVDLAYLRRLRGLPQLSDEDMVREFRTHLFDPSSPTPSIETLVHAFLPPRFIDHSHADAVLTLTNQPNGEELIRKALGDRVAILPYVRPGFDLAKAIIEVYEKNPTVEGVVLIQHGLITFGDDARTSHERHIALVDQCEQFIAERLRGAVFASAAHPTTDPGALVVAAAPILRGLIARATGDEDRPHARSILEWRGGDEVLSILARPSIETLAEKGPLTGDHLIRTKPWPMLVQNPHTSDAQALREQLSGCVEAYRRRYENYVAAHGGSLDGLDSSPRVVWLVGAGLLCWGESKREARIAADIARRTLIAKAKADALGSYRSLPAEDLFHMEFRTLQRVKLRAPCDQPLAGQVVAVSGGAGAIGSAVAEVCADAGAHVAVCDLEGPRIQKVVERIAERHGPGVATGIVMDVTDENSVRRGFDTVVRTFGGVDVLVPNAGVAHVAPIESLAVEDFRRVMDVNATGYLLFMREGIRAMKEQRLGGHIVMVSSKNVFSPGREFAAYSASKAAAHQLGRLAAIELALYGIRVNMLTPDAIFGDAQTPSGLWSQVTPARAQTHQIHATDLPEFYRQRNLLKVHVYGRHVGNAVVFFASNATPTTGSVLPIDGGLPDAFPR